MTPKTTASGLSPDRVPDAVKRLRPASRPIGRDADAVTHRASRRGTTASRGNEQTAERMSPGVDARMTSSPQPASPWMIPARQAAGEVSRAVSASADHSCQAPTSPAGWARADVGAGEVQSPLASAAGRYRCREHLDEPVNWRGTGCAVCEAARPRKVPHREWIDPRDRLVLE